MPGVYTQCPVNGCGRASRSRSRHCMRHAQRLVRYGDPTAVPVTYRRDVGPKYDRWIAEGLGRLRGHPATQAGLTLAQMLLDWTPPPDSVRYRADMAVGQLMQSLRDDGVTAEKLAARVASITAFLQDNPQAARNLRAERFIYARGVINLLAWTGSGSSKRVGALALQSLGEMTTHHLSAWSLRFVARLRADEASKADLKRQALDY